MVVIKAGTSDRWIYEGEVPTDNGGVSKTGHTGKVYWTSGKPKGVSDTATNLDKSTDAEGYLYGFNKYSDTIQISQNSPPTKRYVTKVSRYQADTALRCGSHGEHASVHATAEYRGHLIDPCEDI